MANPFYTFNQTSFPGRIARASEINSQFKLVEQAFDALGTIPGGADTQVQFNDGGDLGGDANFTFNKSTDTLSVTAFAGASATLSGALQAASATVTGVSDLQGNVTVGGTLAVTGKATAAATAGGDSATTVVTKGYAESAFAAASHNHAAADITSGTFVDARIAQSNVTQHQASIDHNALTNYAVAQHRVINDASTAATDLWSAEKINSDIQAVVAGANPPAGSDGMIQYNNGGVAGAQAELSWNDTAYTLTIGTATNAGSVSVVGGKVTSAATAGGDGSTTLTTKGYVEATFALTGHTHAAADVTSGTFADARIPGLPTSKIDSGTFGVARGGTGLNSLVSSNYIRASTNAAFELRTPAQVLADIGAAATSHTHVAGDITSGTLTASRGGTGIGSYTTGNFIRAASASALEQRTPAQVVADIGAAAASHNHSATNITSGVLSTSRLPTTPAWKGGTGLTSLTTGYFLKGNGTSAMSARAPGDVLTDIGAAPVSHNHSAAAITSGVLSVDRIPSLNASKIASGTLPDTRGGTGISFVATGTFLQGNGFGFGYSQRSSSEMKTILNIMSPHVAGVAAKFTVSTSAPSGGANGDIWLKV